MAEAVTSVVAVAAAASGERIDEPNINDVLCGRGGSINSHAGNECFRQLVEKRKRVYLTARFKREKRLIASSIVSEIRAMDPPGRFLARKGGKDNGYWYDIGDEKARDKTSQALRENAPSIRAEIETEINQQRREMKQMEQKDQMASEQGKSSPSSAPSPYPQPPPPHSYYNPQSYWDYYYYYYGYPPPPHPGHAPPPPGTAPPYAHAQSQTHPPPPPGAPPPPPQPNASSSGFGFPWGSPPAHAPAQPQQEAVATAAGNLKDLPPSQISSQEHHDHRMAAALQHQENEAAFEDRNRRLTEDPANKLRQSVAFVSPGCKPLMHSDEDASHVAKASAVASSFGGDAMVPNELTQEELDHRLAVALQEQEDNSLRHQIEHTSRRSSRSNAFPIHGGSNNLCRNNIAWVHNDGKPSSPTAPTAFQQFSSSFAAWTKGNGGSDTQTNQTSSEEGQKPTKSVHFDGNVLPPPSTSGATRDMSYSPLHFEQNQENSSSSLMSQAAGHFLGSVGSWDNSNTAMLESSDGALRARIQEQAAPPPPPTENSVSSIQIQNLQIHGGGSGEGQEVELMDVRDERSMPPPEPRFQIDWPSRVGSSGFMPAPMGNPQGFNSVQKNSGISPAHSFEMDESGNSQLSGNGSLGGGSLCNIFNEKDASPDEIIHRALQQVPSWERNLRSRSPLNLSVGSAEEGDSVIRVRNSVSEKPFGPTMTPIKDDPNEMDTSMDWE